MENIRRDIANLLRGWRDRQERKSLLVRGARQVGKTHSIRELGASFDHFLEVNLEANQQVHRFFEGPLQADAIAQKLGAYFGVPLEPGRSLLFLDEIQACPRALSTLRYFHEQLPDLHVVAAGSLLEFALTEVPSLGVGRIENLFMYPLSFREFLGALGEDALTPVIEAATTDAPVEEPFHRKLCELLRTFMLIGGLPEVVGTYCRERSLIRCFQLLDDIVLLLKENFVRYRARAPVARLREVFDAIPRLTGSKFRYVDVNAATPAVQTKDALGLLVQAALALRVVHSSAHGLPLAGQADERRYKVILFDVGVHQRVLGLDVAASLTASDADLVAKGQLAEVFVGTELVKCASATRAPELHYWHREARNASAEVDYVLTCGERVIPVEVKAGRRGSMHSLHRFLDEHEGTVGVRTSLENFGTCGRFRTVPLYAVRRLRAAESVDAILHG